MQNALGKLQTAVLFVIKIGLIGNVLCWCTF